MFCTSACFVHCANLEHTKTMQWASCTVHANCSTTKCNRVVALEKTLHWWTALLSWQISEREWGQMMPSNKDVKSQEWLNKTQLQVIKLTSRNLFIRRTSVHFLCRIISRKTYLFVASDSPSVLCRTSVMTPLLGPLWPHTLPVLHLYFASCFSVPHQSCLLQ